MLPVPREALDNIQRIVVLDPRRKCVRHFILRIQDCAGNGLCLIRELLPDMGHEYAVTLASQRHDRLLVDVSIGITFAGLERMAVPPPYLGVFYGLTPTFAEGAVQRAAGLGDVGHSAAEHWESAFQPNRAHMLLTLHSNTPGQLDNTRSKLEELFRKFHLDVLTELNGQQLPRPNEMSTDDSDPNTETWVHFGYRDGLSRVKIPGVHGEHGSEFHAPGEFLLGYSNDAGFNPWLLPLADEKVRLFFSNGSFGVFRKMKQDVHAFEAQVKIWARELAAAYPSSSSMGVELDLWKAIVKAKLCGRRPDGGQPGRLDPGDESSKECYERMTGAPLRSRRSAFDAVIYKDDPDGIDGIICPYGAHTRRMNPRGGAVAHKRSRPLIRRGVPYGPAYQSRDDEHQRGLLGHFFCASIEGQFEHLLAQWADRVPLGSPDPGTAKDPFIGQHDDPNACFVVPRPNGRPHVLTGFRPMVTTLGTLYAFYPSRRAMQQMVDLDYLPEDDASRLSWEGIPP
jgi:deferrochelatase/peroxidase EfeB